MVWGARATRREARGGEADAAAAVGALGRTRAAAVPMNGRHHRVEERFLRISLAKMRDVMVADADVVADADSEESLGGTRADLIEAVEGDVCLFLELLDEDERAM